MVKGSRPKVPAQVCDQCGAVVRQPRLLLTPAEAAERAAVGVDKVYEWAHIRGFPALVDGPRTLRIHATLFEQWLANQAQRRGLVA